MVLEKLSNEESISDQSQVPKRAFIPNPFNPVLHNHALPLCLCLKQGFQFYSQWVDDNRVMDC